MDTGSEYGTDVRHFLWCASAYLVNMAASCVENSINCN